MKKSFKKLPTHIAIIMDGNGRWATKRKLARNFGHKEGIKAVERTIDALLKYKIKYATFFAFSTENWKRSKEEIDGIFDLIRQFLKDKRDIFAEKGVKVTAIGDLTKFPKDLQEEFEHIRKNTAHCQNLQVVLALNYGGRADIIQAVNKMVEKGQKVDEKTFLKHLQTKTLPEPDFIIRTSGEMRVSNFLLYQMAYSEFYFPKVLWPDFNEKHLRKALFVFQKRNRRYGGLT